MMKPIPSTYHKLVRYPTPTRTTDIRGDQAATRTILAVTQKISWWKLKKWKLKKARAASEETSPEKKKLKMVATE